MEENEKNFVPKQEGEQPSEGTWVPNRAQRRFMKKHAKQIAEYQRLQERQAARNTTEAQAEIAKMTKQRIAEEAKQEIYKKMYEQLENLIPEGKNGQ